MARFPFNVRSGAWSLIGAGLLWMLLFPALAAADIHPHFRPLVQKLAQAGFDRAWLERVLARPCVTVRYDVLRLRLTVRESKINYAQFTQEPSLNKARKFMADHRATLAKAETDYGVPGGVVTAILLLETRFGEYLGQFHTLSTLATHAAAGQKAVAAEVYRRLPQEEKKRWSAEAAANRLADRVNWSFNELKAFLRYIHETNADPCAVRGSYTGAIGLCQFQPSNLKPYGRDGNGDGFVNLFHVEDAIVSAAAYLQQHGWRKDLTDARRIKVVMTYNNSSPYAKTILEIARLIEP